MTLLKSYSKDKIILMTESTPSRLSRIMAYFSRRLDNHPAIASRPLNDEVIREVAGIQRIADLTLRNTRVVSSEELLDPLSGPTIIREAIEQGCLLLFIEVDLFDLSHLSGQLGEDLQRVDEAGEGSTALCAIHVDLLPSTPIGRSEAVRAALRGMSTVRMRSAAINAMPEDIHLHRASSLSRLVNNPQFFVYIVVFVYSSLRALPVVFIKQFHGSLFVLWSIDIITAVPYTWGVLAMLFAKRWQTRALGTLTTLVTFISPYVYFWFHGRHYPPYVAVVIAALTLLSVLLEFGKFRHERRLRARYRHGDKVLAQQLAA